VNGDAQPILHARDLSVAYGRRTILRGVNIEVGEGDFWFLIGPNGHGKTTFLRCVLRLISPAGGELVLSPVLGGGVGIGFVPQRCDPNPTLPTTVKEFVSLGLVGIRCSRAERTERVRWAIEQVGLKAKHDVDYWSLSGGQRQRALVARALVRKPRLLVLDEPTNGLDLSAEESLLGFLSDLNKRDRLTILCVTHDLAVAARYGSHFALFHDGTVTTGPSSDVLNRTNLERTYAMPIDLARDAGGAISIRIGAVFAGESAS